MTFNRKIIFDTARRLGAKFDDTGDVAAMDRAIDEALGIAQPVRRIGPKGLALIKRFEGLRLTAYKCPADVPTIGYGSTGPHVRMGMTITEAEAEKLLTDDLERFERGVARVGGTMTPGQFSALVSFAFNLGLGALGTSTLLKRHLAGDYAGAAEQFGRWVKAGGRMLQGLITRRAAEAALYRGDA